MALRLTTSRVYKPNSRNLSIATPSNHINASFLRPAQSIITSSSTHRTPSRMFSLSAYRPNQPKTFSQQSKLPRLPIPDLEKSLEGYVKSLIPVMAQKYDPSSLPKELEKRKIYARDFAAPGGLGRALQERIKDLDSVSPNNWLDDTLWLGLAYHTWRAPLLVNSNWWLLFAPDPSDPSPPIAEGSPKIDGIVMTTPNPDPTGIVAKGSQGGGESWLKEHQKPPGLPRYEDIVQKEWISDWQVRKAAWILRRFAEFREKLQKQTIPPDSSKSGPFCMSQYTKIFNLSRIPMANSDAFSVIAPHALHTSVMIDDFIYSIDVFSSPSTPDGIPEPLPVGQIESSLKAAVEDAKNRLENGEEPSRVGILSADERDTWMKNREKLLLLSPKNRKTMDKINTSLITLSLDPYTLPSVVVDDPLRNPPLDAQIRNVATGINGGGNRWFDKAVTVVLENTGRGGIMGEHSPVDALIPSIVVEYVLGEPVDHEQFKGSAAPTAQGGKEEWERLDWVINDGIKAEIEECQGRNRKLIEDSDASQLWWGEFGVEWIKKNAKVAPDAFLQQALQLAWFQDQGYATATYETASTRAFKHGRTDVIRTLSSESRDFVKSMVDPNTTSSKRYELLSKACSAHTNLTKISSTGHGFDRHLMGLKVMLRPGETHALFEDECYAKSQEWKLSTSGLSAGGKFMGTGFGAAWPDGYGINYLAGAYLIKFGIESKISCGETSTAKFKHHIVQALRDMRGVCEDVVGKEAGQAKL